MFTISHEQLEIICKFFDLKKLDYSSKNFYKCQTYFKNLLTESSMVYVLTKKHPRITIDSTYLSFIIHNMTLTTEQMNEFYEKIGI